MLVGAVFFASSPSLTLLSFIPIPIIVWGSVKYQNSLKSRYGKVREAVSELSSVMNTNLGGITTIKAIS